MYYLLSHLLSLFEVAVTLPQFLRLYFLSTQQINVMVVMMPYTPIPAHPPLENFLLIPYLWPDNEQQKLVWHLCACKLMTYFFACSPKLCKWFLIGLPPIDYWVSLQHNKKTFTYDTLYIHSIPTPPIHACIWPLCQVSWVSRYCTCKFPIHTLQNCTVFFVITVLGIVDKSYFRYWMLCCNS